MGICQECLKAKDEVQDTRAERIRCWIIQRFFRKELADYKSDFMAQGMAQGFKVGFDEGVHFYEKLNHYENAKTET